jgi:hypothetical protein
VSPDVDSMKGRLVQIEDRIHTATMNIRYALDGGEPVKAMDVYTIRRESEAFITLAERIQIRQEQEP